MQLIHRLTKAITQEEIGSVKKNDWYIYKALQALYTNDIFLLNIILHLVMNVVSQP